ncbi:sugar phosphate isomerase/epimerase [Bradyrhizobium sp. U87765 SZCCT0131]|uniref:sugar phosphate isomerase/epimerase family protein n=1 Tax=unclassified Bradyrhizobium TaxID=2631580 RepID=UPI001BAC4953|nr:MULTISPECIES: sugar phosphate isomerase/epimerase [unclassified Bradyrhizobium]MBR1218037.1 sugar phosphate isomerase/epimerase [Bradyrhizobium sp. U87765 SZCCT0131]MBR1261017.1 sugar phosphate isomerase/epimerase [Bradyrhizobium sp. U87765 SZCCT0134]MBR1303535.1 sugar phosphate isomerase/epimerase [Bradyrhizobium sp. U87765 SZCCT0110]MBR1319141.1 sugar phosphate isomerase/epimerase [Bradyrhizobium sp. U87765 SZCCT0109]MBR1347466.1 sugar phosphate isomerase/epimerase [Bradyrhizobium sp. U87
MERELVCSSHTVSGVTPGGPVTSRHGFDARVAACAAAGYSGMCLHFRDYAEQRAAGYGDEQLREVLARHGMVHLSVEFLSDWFLSDPDARRNEAMAFDAARAYRAGLLHVGPDLAGRGVSHEQMRTSFLALCERAARRGIAIALEIVAWGNVRDVDTALALIDGIPNAGLVIDIWHFARGGIPFSELARIPADRILSVQLNDGARELVGLVSEDTLHRKLCGEGVFDLIGFVSALDAAGVKVPLSVEVIGPELASRDLADAAFTSFATTWQVIRDAVMTA